MGPGSAGEETGTGARGDDLGEGTTMGCDEICEILTRCEGELGRHTDEAMSGCMASCDEAGAASQEVMTSCIEASDGCFDLLDCIHLK